MMPNILAYPATIFGALLGGYTVVNVNPLYTARELTHQLNDSGARALVVIENFAHVVEEAKPNLKLDADRRRHRRRPDGLQGQHRQFRRPQDQEGGQALQPARLRLAEDDPRRARRRWRRSTVTPDDVAFLQYTGGTTGVAKGATLTHRNVASNVEQCVLWLGWALEPPLGRSDYQHVMVTALPLYHIFALTCCCMFMLRIGAKGLLIANPRDIPGFIKTLKTSRITLFSGVNTLYNALAQHPEIKEVDFSRAALRGRRRHGDPGRRRQALEGRDRPADRRGLRPVRDLAGGLDQPARHHRVLRHDRLSRCPRPTSPSATPRTTTWRWASPARSASAGRR